MMHDEPATSRCLFVLPIIIIGYVVDVYISVWFITHKYFNFYMPHRPPPGLIVLFITKSWLYIPLLAMVTFKKYILSKS